MTGNDGRPWTFLTNHARVLILIAGDPDILLRDVSGTIGITERSVQRIVAELETAGYLAHDRVGRQNRYQVTPTLGLRHPHEEDVQIGLLLDLFSENDADSSTNERRV